MPYTCEQIEERMVDYLDGKLDEKQLRQVKAHLEACTTCAENLALQKAWLDQTVPLIRNDPERIAADNLHVSIMAAVKQAAEKEKNTAAEDESREDQARILLPWYRRLTTRNVLTTAAALIVLVISIQVFAGLYQSNVRTGDPTNDEMAGILAGDGETSSLEYAEEMPFDSDRDDINDNDIGIMGEEGTDTSMPAIIDDGRQEELPELDLFEIDWQVYSGFLADLPVGGSLFSQRDPGETQPVPTTQETDDPDLIAPDDPDADPTDESALIDGDIDFTEDPLQALTLIEQAEAIRVLTREGPPAETLLMTFWNESDTAEAWKNLYMMSQTWPYRSILYQMPAVNAQEQLYEELGAELTDEIFIDIDLSRWEIILIRIGE